MTSTADSDASFADGSTSSHVWIAPVGGVSLIFQTTSLFHAVSTGLPLCFAGAYFQLETQAAAASSSATLPLDFATCTPRGAPSVPMVKARVDVPSVRLSSCSGG